MAEFVPLSHWVWSQMRGEEPRCTGTLTEDPDGSDQNLIAVRCDLCVFEAGIVRPHGRALGGRADAFVPPADSRIESSATEGAPF